MLLRERRTLPRKFTTSIACDLETKEWLHVYAQKYNMTLAEALYEIVNRTVAIEEGFAKGPKLRI